MTLAATYPETTIYPAEEVMALHQRGKDYFLDFREPSSAVGQKGPQLLSYQAGIYP